jgi:predicted MPP superfamily phosphohydrolase
MRRDRLHPPQTAFRAEAPGTAQAAPAVGEEPLFGLGAGRRRRPRGAATARVGPPPRKDLLDAPLTARERRRMLFDPRSGWFRAVERAASHWLSDHVYPRIPGANLPYDALLRRTLTLSEARVEIEGLPVPFDGLRVLLVTDIHAGPFVSPPALGAALRKLLGLEPDLILVGGDLVSSRVADFATHREAFALLKAPLGTYAVLGNHDHYTGAPARLAELAAEEGIEVLHNRSVDLSLGGETLSLAGVDDLVTGRPDLEAALSRARPPVLLLSHNPDLLFDAARGGAALVLSGHTHAGQVRLPGLPVLIRQSRYRLDQGRYRVGATELLVSRGLGVVGVPLRLACPPEAVLLELKTRKSPA